MPRFLYQLLSDENFFEFAIKFSKGSKMLRGDKNKIMDYDFFIPSLPVQNYIVSILDKFDILVNDIKQGLPKEIELRQKQYEYFKKRLLHASSPGILPFLNRESSETFALFYSFLPSPAPINKDERPRS